MFSFIPKIIGLFGSSEKGPNVIVDSIKSIGETVDELFTSTEEIGKLSLAKEELKFKLNALQAEVMKAEIQSGRGKWRSALGWICTVCFGYYYFFQLAFASYTSVDIFFSTGKVIQSPFDYSTLWQLLCALLGIGIIKTVEKKKAGVI